MAGTCFWQSLVILSESETEFTYHYVIQHVHTQNHNNGEHLNSPNHTCMLWGIVTKACHNGSALIREIVCHNSNSRNMATGKCGLSSTTPILSSVNSTSTCICTLYMYIILGNGVFTMVWFSPCSWSCRLTLTLILQVGRFSCSWNTRKTRMTS